VGTGSRSWVKKGRTPILARAKWSTQVNPAVVMCGQFLAGSFQERDEPAAIDALVIYEAREICATRWCDSPSSSAMSR